MLKERAIMRQKNQAKCFCRPFLLASTWTRKKISLACLFRGDMQGKGDGYFSVVLLEGAECMKTAQCAFMPFA